MCIRDSIKKNPQRPYNNAWEMAMNIHDNKVVPTGKVLFFIDGKEASEEELKNIPANEVRGVSRIDNSGEGETTIRVETERNSDKWVLASGIVMDKEGKPMEGAVSYTHLDVYKRQDNKGDVALLFR